MLLRMISFASVFAANVMSAQAQDMPPPLTPVTPDECRRFASAKMRRQLRQELEQRFQQIRQPGAC